MAVTTTLVTIRQELRMAWQALRDACHDCIANDTQTQRRRGVVLGYRNSPPTGGKATDDARQEVAGRTWRE